MSVRLLIISRAMSNAGMPPAEENPDLGLIEVIVEIYRGICSCPLTSRYHVVRGRKRNFADIRVIIILKVW